MITNEKIRKMTNSELILLQKVMNHLCIGTNCCNWTCEGCPYERLCEVAIKIDAIAENELMLRGE